MTEHNILTGTQLHEPKGVAAASEGEIYIADGTGSGDWTDPQLITGDGVAGSTLIADGSGNGSYIRYQGWSQWEDTDTTVGTPSQNIATGVRTLWSNDGGTLSLEKNPSDATSSMWNTSTNKHTPIAEYDIYHLRMSFIAENYAGSTPYIDVELDIGGAVGTIMSRGISLRKGGAAQNVSVSFPVFAGSTYLANGGEFYITYTGTGTCDIYNSSILIVRESKNYV